MNDTIFSSSRLVPLIPVRNVVVYPTNEVVLTFGRKKSINSINYALGKDKLVALFTQRDGKIEDPQFDDLYSIGTLCVVERTLKTDGELNALVKGIARIKLVRLENESTIELAEIEELGETVVLSQELEALARHLTTQFREAVNLGKSVEFTNFMRLMSGVSISELSDQIAPTLSISLTERQALLEILDLQSRLYKINDHLAKELKVLEIEKTIASKTQEKFSKNMKENVLRERMATIKSELGELDEEEAELDDLHASIKKLELPKNDKVKVLKEFDRLYRMSPNNPESGYIRTWIETVTELPWGKLTADHVSLKTAEQILNDDHYGLKEVKERILEYLAVMKLKRLKNNDSALPTILCFVGPPGVGKTSLGKSIARALKRKFVKVSLGGIRDEAEIRGHRKTYVGAMPGRIIEGIKTAGSMNPVFMLDEIDKVGNDFRGDPSAALLEALDPEQNKEFSDHYLEIPMDLSRTMFIATANVLDTIPSALLDRLETIHFSSYTRVEKFHIAKKYLLPKVIEKNAIQTKNLKISNPILREIINKYTREAGVRSLERELAKIARKVAKKIASNGKKPLKLTTSLTAPSLHEYLGPAKYSSTIAEKVNPIGMATGLAWTSVGGEILFIEVSTMPGKGTVQITGQLGEVMKESAAAAYTYVRSHYKDFDLKPNFYKTIDLHIHVPEGAVPKDGPSAGVTMTTAIVSALTGRAIKKNIGMTGEVTLRGRILEIGGLKEKVIAAHTAGLRQIIHPWDNTKDLEKIPAEIKKDLTFHPVKEVSEVLKLALV
ncbi:endopeptidase La [Candidatus Collierbacteria bacterium CG10_big_fil_rev_8_21_14_0_10_44_9]|uniref:Lon protease n=1 Tax=Candidatus Collierbacteria bacterium CG10_big_fil_rev_8_21_14_0_10_44_9 TaxID=1974535 RepID=A0A2H0VIE5_9BACT|nr:MAG: endopeptidase La [Candidatus Collierbacteria bacterium CG10_big_fil_rev_8_21_14_0_10_44_9]